MTITDIVISGDNFKSSTALDDIIHKKFERLLSHYGHFMTDVEVILKIDSDGSEIAEANVNVHDKQINASASTDDMYKSVDEMTYKLKIQLEKYKELHLSHQKKHRDDNIKYNADALLAEE
jgi:ribosomal subunit interface protein